MGHTVTIAAACVANIMFNVRSELHLFDSFPVDDIYSYSMLFSQVSVFYYCSFC